MILENGRYQVMDDLTAAARKYPVARTGTDCQSTRSLKRRESGPSASRRRRSSPRRWAGTIPGLDHPVLISIALEDIA